MADITMSLDDTLELDAVIEEWNDPSNIVEDSDGKFNLSGIQTSTRILDPQESGTHTIKVNGQELTVEVTETSTIPNGVVDNFEDGNKTIPKSNWSGWNVSGSFTVQQNTVLDGQWSGRINYIDSSTSALINANRDTPFSPSEYNALIRVDNTFGNNDGSSIVLLNGTTRVCRIGLAQSDTWWYNKIDNNISGSYSVDTTYKFRIYNIDFNSETFDAEFIRTSDSKTVASSNDLPFQNSADNIDAIRLTNDSNSTGSEVNVFCDNPKLIS